MGSNQSSHAYAQDSVDIQQHSGSSSSVRGRKAIITSKNNHVHNDPTETTERIDEDFGHSYEDEEEDDELDMPLAVMEEEEESEEEVDEEDMVERARILEDAYQLKKLATMFMHPEAPVQVHITAFSRCFFDRPSARTDEEDIVVAEDEVEAARILEDAKALKKLAMDYMHPEVSVKTTDPTACARCFFDRPSATEQEDEEFAIMTDAAALKQSAVQFLHPELPVATTDANACGRSYFDRPSAVEQEDVEEADERARILEEMTAMKKLAVDYLHPEISVTTSDPTAFARNYFTRPFAPEQDLEETNQVLADVMALKELAIDYLHPEFPVTTTDPAAFGRNFFTRPSAPEEEHVEDEEIKQVLADASALKKLAVDFYHPELPVVTSDPTSFGRNFFARPSAFEEEDDEEERLQSLADAMKLKKLAADFLHPELPVGVADPNAFGRNYFTRPSAPEQEDDEERQQVLSDVKALKKMAVDYLHPEMPVVATDAALFGRNYFARFSAPEQEDLDENERQHILADAAALKKQALDYLHPELPVDGSDPTIFGRNYFTRPSAPGQEDLNEERELVLAEAKALKKLAVDYVHPETPVVATDPTAFGRNYFTRSSAPDGEDLGDEEERTLVLVEAQALKTFAVDFLHPELPVSFTDPAAFGRNYFTRPSAPEQVYDSEEFASVLEDVAVLKKLAVDYAHPELPVAVTDPTLFGRNYFTRASAPAQVFPDDAEDRSYALEESASLKKSAMDYAHPELPCVTTDPTSMGRNYFNRPSAPGHADFIHTSGYDNNDSKMHYIHCDEVSQEHHDDFEHHDHFEMDEDIWNDVYSTLHLPDEEVALKGGSNNSNSKLPRNAMTEDEEEEGKLSRSPSSVMLFEQGMEGY